MVLLNVAYGIAAFPASVLALGFGVLGQACGATKTTGSMTNSYNKSLTQAMWLVCA